MQKPANPCGCTHTHTHNYVYKTIKFGGQAGENERRSVIAIANFAYKKIYKIKRHEFNAQKTVF